MNADKKKLLVVVLLVLVILGVGAFQMVGSFVKSVPVPVVKKLKPKKEDAEKAKLEADAAKKIELLALAGGVLPSRDPFAPQFDIDPAPKQAVKPPTKPTPAPRSGARMAGGSIPLLPRLLGNLPRMGEGPGPGPELDVQPGKPLVDISQPRFRVRGVILGTEPMAVIEDEQGNQRLVPAGRSVNNDSTIVAVRRGHVVVRHRGETKQLRVEGATSE